MSIVPATDSYDHNTVLKDLSARIIVVGVVGFVVIWWCTADLEWLQFNAPNQPEMDRRITRFIFVLR